MYLEIEGSLPLSQRQDEEAEADGVRDGGVLEVAASRGDRHLVARTVQVFVAAESANVINMRESVFVMY